MPFPFLTVSKKERPSQRHESSEAPTVDRFRALIVGRANAGKTTILKSICGSKDDPLIMGKVTPSAERGEHNISTELSFASNPRFIFHDSRGFEAGTKDEVEVMMSFINERADASTLQEKLHAIWYCVPTDNDRLDLAAEERFFDHCDPAGVPVILLFTKFDAREARAFRELEREGKTVEEAGKLATERAEKIFNEREVNRFKSRKYPPKAIIYLRGMDDEANSDENTQCSQIIDVTTQNLKDETLRHLLVSVQKVNIKLCVKYALQDNNIREALLKEAQLGSEKSKVTNTELWREINSWFPHFYETRQNYGKPIGESRSRRVSRPPLSVCPLSAIADDFLLERIK